MEMERILVPDSMQETLWRLEEVRQGFRSKTPTDVKEALDWILTRQGLERSYHNLFAPTSGDISQGLQLLTGERYTSRNALTRHVLGEEALRTVIAWGLRSSPSTREAMKGFNYVLEKGGSTGRYCCYTCRCGNITK